MDEVRVKFEGGILDIYAEKKRLRVNTKGEVTAVGKIINSVYRVDGLAEVLYDFVDKVLEEPWVDYFCKEFAISCATEGFEIEVNSKLYFKTKAKGLQCIVSEEEVRVATLIGTFIEENTRAFHEERIDRLVKKHNLLTRGEGVRVEVDGDRFVMKSAGKGKVLVIDPWSVAASCKCIVNLNEKVVNPEIIVEWVEGIAYEAVKSMKCDIEMVEGGYVFRYGNFVFEYDKRKKAITGVSYQGSGLMMGFGSYWIKLRGKFLKTDLRHENLEPFYGRLTEIFRKLVNYLEL